jgi:hypothetical protein
MMAQLTSNKGKEDAAIAWVMNWNVPPGVSHAIPGYAGAPADIESPPRLIEVKSAGTSMSRQPASELTVAAFG